MKTGTEGNTSATQGPGCAVPMGNKKSPRLSNVQGTTRPVLDPEAPDTLMDMLQHASVLEEHRTLIGIVVEKVLSVKSGLNGAFMGLLRGFEVCTRTCSIVFYSQNTPVYR